MSSSLSESPIFEYYLRKVMDKIEGPPFGSYLITSQHVHLWVNGLWVRGPWFVVCGLWSVVCSL